MKIFNRIKRKKINEFNRSRLKNHDFSIIASTCNGGCISHDLGLRFNSPTINLWIPPSDFIKFLQNIQYYLNCDMTFTIDPNRKFPVGILDDIKIYFQHYKTEKEAKNKWIERSKRINFDNLFIIFTDRDGCTYQNLCDFDKLPYKNKVVFTHVPYPEIKSAYYIKGWENEECVGVCSSYKEKFSGEKFYDDFDYVGWFNQEMKN